MTISKTASKVTRQELIDMLIAIRNVRDGEMLVSDAMHVTIPFFKESALWCEIDSREAGLDNERRAAEWRR